MSRIHLGLQSVRSCPNQTMVHRGACDPHTGCPEQAQGQAHAVPCQTVLHVLLGLKYCAVLHISLKLNWLTIMEKPGAHSHVAPVMMSPVRPYLERKQHILFLRKSYKNFEDRNASESQPRWEVCTAFRALTIGQSDAASISGFPASEKTQDFTTCCHLGC